MKVRVTNIQRFSLHDGPGIRTTVFLKGCSLKCPWCSNPENINYGFDKYYDMDENYHGVFGYDIELKKLEEEILKDQNYYSVDNGGVTFTGGEALLQFDKLEPLLQNLNDKNISVCIETSLYASKKMLEIAIKYVSYFIIDIKILDFDIVKNVLGGNLNNYYKNLDYLFSRISNDKILFRIPVTKEYTFSKNNINSLIELLRKYKPLKVELFKIHKLGEKKYKVLKRDLTHFMEVSKDELLKLKEIIEQLGISCHICEI